jgi:hypothetical protein
MLAFTSHPTLVILSAALCPLIAYAGAEALRLRTGLLIAVLSLSWLIMAAIVTTLALTCGTCGLG